MILLDGKHLATTIQAELREKTEKLVSSGQRAPHLAAILVGNDGASQTYVNAKVNACKTIGFGSTLVRLEDTVTEAELLHQIELLNTNPEIDGFIVQLPLPKHIDADRVLQAIDPAKDVDGFHPTNFGKMAQGLDAFIPATPYGILTLLQRYSIPTKGKHCVVVGRSNIVGKPMSILMGRAAEPGNCTVTLTHSATQNLEEVCQSADILIVALGKPEFVKANMVKAGAVVIDVGITRLEDASAAKGYRIVGDVDFNDVAPQCSYITPVPGGVGAMTVTALIMNTWKARTGLSL